MPNHLFLTGYRGTGKSAVGSIVAQRLGRSLVDLDDLVEKNAGSSIREIFAERNEAGFRELESEALFALTDPSPLVVSLGGGAILRESNRRWIAENGFCVWLDADAKTIAERLFADESTESRRPALTDLDALAEISTVLDQRRPLYEAAADLRIWTAGRSIEQVADELIQAIGRIESMSE